MTGSRAVVELASVDDAPRAGKRAGLVVFATLLGIYVATLAPDITLWDSGEFNAAIVTTGIPHPPGTPLYILVANVWARLFGMLPQALAVNGLSAVATAAGCALLARVFARSTGSAIAGIAAGLAAGVTLSVWQNATETEVYALSFLLLMVLMTVGDLAGTFGSRRYRMLLVYLMALAVPLQISALVAAPAAIALAASASTDDRPPSIWHLGSLGAAALLITGLGVVSAPLIAAGVAAFGTTTVLSYRRGQPERGEPAAYAVALGLGMSAALFMLVRASHDPGINQGNPSTWQAFVDVIGRRQYDVPAPWPRRAPFWLQLGNLVQYADWQVARALDGSVAPSWWRTPWSIAFGALSVLGARWHWRTNRRHAQALGMLFLAASLGVVVVLNLRAGPSIGAGVLPADALHEARERDYFFAPAFAVAAAWAGLGAVGVARRISRRLAGLGIAAASLPVLLNWTAATRRPEPGASLAREFGAALLQSAPPRAVLLVAGDNDSYSIWYQQRVRHFRADVTAVTTPLLGAAWYRAELARRDTLVPHDAVRRAQSDDITIAQIAASARALHRPLAVAVSVPRQMRMALARTWTLRGLVFVADAAQAIGSGARDEVDSALTSRVAESIDRAIPRLDARTRDPTANYVLNLLSCPRLALEASDDRSAGLLASRCNFK